MTASAVYFDSNFSVEIHEHRPEIVSMDEGDEIRCATCGKRLLVVCPDGHADPLQSIRYSKGPVPAGPKGGDRRRALHIVKTRTCVCGNEITEKAKKRCESCRSKPQPRNKTPRQRKAIATTKVCRTCQTEKPIENFEIVYAHYRRADCRKCRSILRKKSVSPPPRMGASS